MGSQKSIAEAPRVPKRQRGHLRVAALLEAGAAVFADKGFDAATMTEIAARAGAAIGSLYQFFPSKQAIAEALLARYTERLGDGFAGIAARAPGLPPAALAAALVDLMLDRSADRAMVLILVDAAGDAAGLRTRLRAAARTQIAAILRAAAPALPPERAKAKAIVVLHMLKAIPVLADEEAATQLPLLVEARAALTFYLAAT